MGCGNLQWERVGGLGRLDNTATHEPPAAVYTVSVGVHPGDDTEGLRESVSEFWAGWDKAKLCLTPPDPDSDGGKGALFSPFFLPTSPLPCSGYSSLATASHRHPALNSVLQVTPGTCCL